MTEINNLHLNLIYIPSFDAVKMNDTWNKCEMDKRVMNMLPNKREMLNIKKQEKTMQKNLKRTKKRNKSNEEMM